MGLAESALILLGIGIVSSRFQAGTGLSELGTGIQTLVAAPLTGTGTGLSIFSGGLRDLAMSLGDIGRGFGTLFSNIPPIQGWGDPLPYGGGLTPPSGGGASAGLVPDIFYVGQTRPLIPDGGDNKTQLLAGGGGNVPRNGVYQTPSGAWTFPGAPTWYVREEAAMKNYRLANQPGVNNV